MKTIAIQHQSEKQSKIFKVEWNLGKRCNFNCSYCDEYTHDNFSDHLKFEVAKKTIDKLKNQFPEKTIKINLTGGEPTINPDFEKLVDYMNSQDIKIGVTTNGSRTYKFYEKIIPKIDSLIFSYHMEYHKRQVLPATIVDLYNYKNTFEKYVHLHVHMMMLPTMFDEADRTIKYFKSNGVPIVLRRIRPAYMKDELATYNHQGQLIDGKIAMPNYPGTVTLKFKNGQSDYSYEGQPDYYSKEELEYLNNMGI
jgi:MoaA/NifB/PqqE/SkfB family radical SAM enzyme